ncbi:hypothetical protein RFM26_08135 [Mesorhizobium sp. VK23B]|uniref:Uncharacterized protein n=1 Tax=Mesorhizobium dulcispinae TaxID=3072316 RepID=A0ABU4X9T0_9HYPH|nr:MULTISPECIES: hypothetical protein [unclassified Mesorhizobium]MDX8465648.1 hypothetical protein [Mesorhizobium sp. VK23B]MDX8471550.1 hypothetical protein [Mesorhizobium sp. VK23A]
MKFRVKWREAEQALASAGEHGYLCWRINSMLEKAGIPVRSVDERQELQAKLWATATPESARAHLYLAVKYAEPEQVAEAGLDRFFALVDALQDRHREQRPLVSRTAREARSLVRAAALALVYDKGDLFAFLGSQEIEANEWFITCRRDWVMRHDRAALLAAATPHGIWKLRGMIANGREHFDRAVAAHWAVRQRPTRAP